MLSRFSFFSDDMMYFTFRKLFSRHPQIEKPQGRAVERLPLLHGQQPVVDGDQGPGERAKVQRAQGLHDELAFLRGLELAALDYASELTRGE
jgi:hypothetical protein